MIDDTSGYPTSVINKLYADVQALNPRPPFSISTGDYMFAKPYGPLGAGQVDLYMAARQQYSGVFFPAMGNHDSRGPFREAFPETPDADDAELKLDGGISAM